MQQLLLLQCFFWQSALCDELQLQFVALGLSCRHTGNVTHKLRRERQKETNRSAALLDLTGHVQQRRTALHYATAVPCERFPVVGHESNVVIFLSQLRVIPLFPLLLPFCLCSTFCFSSSSTRFLLHSFLLLVAARFSGSFDASEMSTVEENDELSELSS